MKTISKIIICLSAVALLLMPSCTKEGCTDSVASNYNSDATSDDGSCKYYYGGKNFGQIDVGSKKDTDNEYNVYIDGSYIGRLTMYFPNGLSCGNPNVPGGIYASGSHKVKVVGNGGTPNAEKTITLNPQECKVVLVEDILGLTGGGGGGTGNCTGSYQSPTPNDAQLDALCQAAYTYRCGGYDSQADLTCQQYNSLANTGTNVPRCSYCN